MDVGAVVGTGLLVLAGVWSVENSGVRARPSEPAAARAVLPIQASGLPGQVVPWSMTPAVPDRVGIDPRIIIPKDPNIDPGIIFEVDPGIDPGIFAGGMPGAVQAPSFAPPAIPFIDPRGRFPRFRPFPPQPYSPGMPPLMPAPSWPDERPDRGN